MVNKCAIKGCKTLSFKGSKVHVIPNGYIGELWVKAVKRVQPNFVPTKRTVICKLHFVNTDYVHSVDGEKLVLKKSAVPSVFDSDTSVSTCLTTSTLRRKDSKKVIGVIINDLHMPNGKRTWMCLPMPNRLHETDKEREITSIINDLLSSNNSEASCMLTSMNVFLESFISLVGPSVSYHARQDCLEIKRLRSELQSLEEKLKIQNKKIERLNKVYNILDNNKTAFDVKQQ